MRDKERRKMRDKERRKMRNKERWTDDGKIRRGE